ncbi:oligosaccharide flippase family protein [Parvibium lacunae]|uniref:oligosaccharide flippase family protein n=1 Tax=Parvibium lacunae TaxID=1888893 RepID=UPI0023D9331A|nr:oligosaccharide flippase family protein [Parvibium lacunae]
MVSKLIPLASIFIYSRFMNVSDYGVLNLTQSYLWIFVLILSFNLHVSVGRYIYEPGASEGPFLASTILAVGLVFFLGIVVIFFNSARVSSLLDLPLKAIVLMIVGVMGMLAESLLTQLMIRDQRSSLLLIAITIKAIFSFIFCIYFLSVLSTEKYMAILIAESIASLGLCIYTGYFLRRRIVWKMSFSNFIYMARYAVPLIPYMLSLTLLSQFDRVLLNKYYGSEITGYYSLAYNFGALLMMAAGAALNAYTPAFFDALNKNDFEKLKQDSDILFNCCVAAAAFLVIWGPDLAKLILPPKYRAGFYLIPLVALGGLCSVIFQCWIRVLAYEHRTILISGIAIFGAIFGISTNLWLLPKFGYQIAAVVSLATYLMMSLLCVLIVNHVTNLRIGLAREVMWILLLAVLIPLSHGQSNNLGYLLKSLFLFICIWPHRHSIKSLLTRGAS